MSVRRRAQRAPLGGGPPPTVALKRERVAAALAREIRSGGVRRGMRLPGEVSLARRFAVSRNTIREALAELSDAGLIATRNGKGSFVVFGGSPFDPRADWPRARPVQGATSAVRVLAIRRERNAALADELGLPGPDLVVVERAHTLPDGVTVGYVRNTVAATGALADLPERGLDEGSLTRTLANAGIVASRGAQRVRCRPLGEDEAALLGRPAGTWFLRSNRTSWTADGRFAERLDLLLDAEHFELDLDLGQDAWALEDA